MTTRPYLPTFRFFHLNYFVVYQVFLSFYKKGSKRGFLVQMDLDSYLLLAFRKKGGNFKIHLRDLDALVDGSQFRHPNSHCSVAGKDVRCFFPITLFFYRNWNAKNFTRQNFLSAFCLLSSLIANSNLRSWHNFLYF